MSSNEQAGLQKTQNNSDAQSAESLAVLMEKNLKWSQIIYEQNRSIKRRLSWMVAGDYIRLLLIVAPIVLAIIYLPPFIRGITEKYRAIFSGSVGGGIISESDIMRQIGQFLQKNNGSGAPLTR